MARPRKEEQALIMERRTRVLAMRVEQRPYREIAIELGISEDVAEKDYQRAVEARKNAFGAQRDPAVEIETAKLDAIEQAVWEVLRRRHITISQGRIVGRYTGRFLRDEDGEIIRDGTGKPLLEVEEIEDDAPVLQAADRLIRIAERRARLRGYDAPVRAKVEVTDALDADIERLVAELAGLAPGSEAAPEGAPGGGGGQAQTA